MWAVNANFFVEYNFARSVPKWLFHMMMLGKDVSFYGKTNVGWYRIGRDMQRLWHVEKDKDTSTVPFHHTRLPVYSSMSGPVTANMYQFDEHIMWIGTTSC